jgi:hypothetical protein
VKTTTSDYIEQQLESDQGALDVGVELALYFQRVAPTVASEYGILADPNLLEAAQTIFGLSPATSATNAVINSNGLMLSNALNAFTGAPAAMLPNALMTSLHKFTLGG